MITLEDFKDYPTPSGKLKINCSTKEASTRKKINQKADPVERGGAKNHKNT